MTIASAFGRPAGLVTIDVEPDNVWAKPEGTGFENIRQLPRFHALCRDHGVRPTYLVSYAVAEDSASVVILEKLLAHGMCEIGMHPHLWETPPLLPMDRQGQAWPGPAYPADALAEKLGRLQSLLARRFGTPRSHRAGRYGLDARQVPMLTACGITTDTSVTPRIDWTSTGAPDYSSARLTPYFLSPTNILQSGDSSLLEVPCTVRPGVKFGGLERTRVGRLMLRRFGRDSQWLRGSPQASSTSLTAVNAWAVKRTPCLNLMTHSSELCAGTSPYWKTEVAVSAHLSLCSAVFRWWQAHAVVPQTLQEFRAGWSLQQMA
ncbi:MAG: hypothetical protein RL077_4310 [Verrucomicrobiota bacterium]|jgi:hypothetical protein